MFIEGKCIELKTKLGYMREAIELAEKGRGYVSPNPMVGALIVKDGKVIAKGYHEKYGDSHAEVNAFKEAEEKNIDVRGSDMYVTLEPCSHYGITPPCSDLIVDKEISRVFIGVKDPNPLVAGKGIEKLENAGIKVEYGFLENEIKKQNEVFFYYIENKLPFCLMKTAMTLDGKICTKTGDSKWISNEISREYVHKLRHWLMGIMVGVNTIIKDNPLLNTRIEGLQVVDTIKIIVDSTGRIPLDAKIINRKWSKPVIVATTNSISEEKELKLKEKDIIVLKIDSNSEGRVDLQKLMRELGNMKIDSVLIEGGGTLNFSALESNIVNKVESFISPKIIGGADSLTPIEGEGIKYIKNAFMLKNIEIDKFDEDILVKGYIK